MADNDGTDILKCRWSNANFATNYNRMDECEGACLGLIGISTLYEENCTLVFTLPVSPINYYYVVALQIEDYFNSTATIPMSSVPIQFLFYAYAPSGSCTTRPVILGERPNRGRPNWLLIECDMSSILACIGTPISKYGPEWNKDVESAPCMDGDWSVHPCSICIDVTITERVIAKIFCSGTNVTNFVTSSPIGMQHSPIIYQGNGKHRARFSLKRLLLCRWRYLWDGFDMDANR